MTNSPKRKPSSALPASDQVRAFVLIQVVPGKVGNIVRSLNKMDEVKSVDPVTGPFDIVAQVEVGRLHEISSLVAGAIGGLRGVTRTTTLLCT